MQKVLRWFRSSTVVGIVTGLTGVISSPDVLALLPPKYATLLTALGAALAAFGIRRKLPAPE